MKSLSIGFILGILLCQTIVNIVDKEKLNSFIEENTRLIETNTRLNNQNLDLNKRCVYKELK